MTNGHQLDSIDSRLERLTQAVEQQHQNIEELIAGMGLLIEASTEFRSNLAEIKTATQQQAETAERQERNIQQLAETVSRQAETAERQSRIDDVNWLLIWHPWPFTLVPAELPH